MLGPMSAHVLAVATAAAAFVLILAGGLVHGTGSGLACPDWPLCRGQVFPAMTGGVAYEHGHRLIAAVVIVLCVALAFVLRRTRGRLRVAAFTVVGLILVQAGLGGLTVLWRLPAAITSAHQAVSLLVFMITVYLAVRTRSSPVPASAEPPSRAGLVLAHATVFAIYAQMVLGAVMRHTASGLACVDFPRCLGTWWPSGTHAQLNMAHRLAGVVAAALVIATAIAVLRMRPRRRAPLALAASAPVLVLFQIWLGWRSLSTLLDLHTVMTHMALAALLLALQLTLALMWRPAQAIAAAESASGPAPTQAPAPGP